MSNIKDYWTLDMASEGYGVSRNSLDKWRKDAVESGLSELSEPDAVYGNTQLFHKDKWHKVLEFHYFDDIARLAALGLVISADTLDAIRNAAYDEGYHTAMAEGYERGRIAGPRHDLPKFTLPEATEPLEETNEPLVAYATTKGPDFAKLTDGQGFQSIV